MADAYYSDRELGPRPRSNEEIPGNVWAGIVAAIRTRVADGSFGFRYGLRCPDGSWIYACDEPSFSLALMAEVPGVAWPLDSSSVPPKLAVLDLVEFCYRIVAKPNINEYHGFFRHFHLGFGVDEGRAEFREEINRIFARNGIAFEIDSTGRIIRLIPSTLSTILRTTFKTGDNILDQLLEAAMSRYLDPDSAARQEALEKLWDAWERIKTIEPGADKKQSTAILLTEAAAEPHFRSTLEKEARELTDIGNEFRIRHSETSQIPLGQEEHIDYLFQRLFAIIRLLLRATGRA
jgi:hypothetical protein